MSSPTGALARCASVLLGLEVGHLGDALLGMALEATLQRHADQSSASNQAAINGGLTIWCWLVSLGCAFLVDRVGRRTLFLIAGVGMLIAFSVWTACSAVYEKTGNPSAGSAVLAMIFLFYGGYGVGWLAGSIAAGLLYQHSLVALVAFAIGAQLASIPPFLAAGRREAAL